MLTILIVNYIIGAIFTALFMMHHNYHYKDKITHGEMIVFSLEWPIYWYVWVMMRFLKLF